MQKHATFARPRGVQARGLNMKPMALAGILLIVIGLAALAYQGFTYTTRETIVDIGPIEATADRERTVPLPPIVGIVAVAGGIALLVAGSRR
jgi:uncharacterized membrane protein HdeD (DUF308 family)